MQDTGPFIFTMHGFLDQARKVGLSVALAYALQQPGDVAEFGVAAGDTASEFQRYLRAKNISKRLHLFDTFTGLPRRTAEDGEGEGGEGMYAFDQHHVERVLGHGPDVAYYPGLFALYRDTFATPLCFAHIDADLYAGTRDALLICQRVLVPRGVVVIDDYGTHWRGVTLAAHEVLDWSQYITVCSEGTGQLVAIRRPRRRRA